MCLKEEMGFRIRRVAALLGGRLHTTHVKTRQRFWFDSLPLSNDASDISCGFVDLRVWTRRMREISSWWPDSLISVSGTQSWTLRTPM